MEKDPLEKIKAKTMKIVSWNLLHKSGAMVDEISRIIDLERPEIFLMQEATEQIDCLQDYAGGQYQRQEWPNKRHGLAIWSSRTIAETRPVALPYSRLPGSFPQRRAQLIDVAEVTIANVHLSHGQVLNRRQLTTIANSTEGPTVIMGDYNAIGPVKLKQFKDVGPRKITHTAQRVMPFRLDRCMVRELHCNEAWTLHRGGSDHNPIVVELSSRSNA